MYKFWQFSLFCYILPLLFPGDITYGLLDRCRGHCRKCLHAQSADGDSQKIMLSCQQGNREDEDEEEEAQWQRWQKGRWSGGRGGLSWRTDKVGFVTFLLSAFAFTSCILQKSVCKYFSNQLRSVKASPPALFLFQQLGKWLLPNFTHSFSTNVP